MRIQSANILIYAHKKRPIAHIRPNYSHVRKVRGNYDLAVKLKFALVPNVVGSQQKYCQTSSAQIVLLKYREIQKYRVLLHNSRFK